MLQQTQVSRVIEKYREFLKRFPTVHALAKASLADVLKVWSGLGYNRRAKYLHDAAKTIVAKHKGKVPKDILTLGLLPGMGPYTASALRVFAFNEPDILIETNIRTAFIHHFWPFHKSSDRPRYGTVADTDIFVVAQKAAEGQDSRKWHWALMDYGAYLKRSGVRNNHRSVRYTKQSPFEGSLRQVRGAILRELQRGSQTENTMRRRLMVFEGEKVRKALEGLARDGLIVNVRPRRIGLGPKKGKWRIA